MNNLDIKENLNFAQSTLFFFKYIFLIVPYFIFYVCRNASFIIYICSWKHFFILFAIENSRLIILLSYLLFVVSCEACQFKNGYENQCNMPITDAFLWAMSFNLFWLLSKMNYFCKYMSLLYLLAKWKVWWVWKNYFSLKFSLSYMGVNYCLIS